MRNNKGSKVLAALISVGLLIAAIMTGPGKFTYITLLVMLGLSLVVNLFGLAND